jgi:hypothetical protein
MPNELTELQKDVLTRLRNRNCLFLASATEDHWKRGEGYYIDDRVNVPARLRAKFEKGNRQALGEDIEAKKHKKTFVKQLAPYIELHFDERTGLAWVENGSAGCGHTCHPNIDKTGSVRGMKKLGYWAQSDRMVRSHGFIYNIDRLAVSDKWDEVAREHCRCGGKH